MPGKPAGRWLERRGMLMSAQATVANIRILASARIMAWAGSGEVHLVALVSFNKPGLDKITLVTERDGPGGDQTSITAQASYSLFGEGLVGKAVILTSPTILHPTPLLERLRGPGVDLSFDFKYFHCRPR